MTGDLEKRLKRIEDLYQALQPIPPGLIYFSDKETEEQARARYRREHGFDLPPDAPVICFEAVDCRKPIPKL